MYFSQSNSSFEVIVVGVGAMGAAACWHLARRGIRVLGLEQSDIPNGDGSSHGYSRMTRMAYYEDPSYVPLIRRAHELWAELEAATATKIFHRVGGLYVGPADGPLLNGASESARRHRIPSELLNQRQLSDRYPQFRTPANWVGLFEPGAGYLVPEAAISAFAVAAMDAGAEIHAHEEVTAWQTDAAGVSVTTTRGKYTAGQVIFAGGAWSSGLVGQVATRVVVTRQVLGWVWPRDASRYRLGAFPVWMIDRQDGTVYYGFPMVNFPPGLKVAVHAPLTPCSPATVDRKVSAADEETFRACLREYLPDADGPLLALRTCLYQNSPDGHFIVDKLPGQDRVVVACGFSGHGFKFSSAIGEALADLATQGRSALPISLFSIKRFGARIKSI